jgi:uncharacterized RDD family membrane protein YckC
MVLSRTLRIASIKARFFAACLDLSLALVLALVLLLRFVLPEEHASAMRTYDSLYSGYMAAAQTAWEQGEEAPPPPDIQQHPEVVEMLIFSQLFVILVVWMYLSLSHTLMGGTTLGKRICKIMLVQAQTGLPPGPLTYWLRGGVVAFTAVLGPVLWVSFLVLFLNKSRRAGHDWMSRTCVIESETILTRLKPAQKPIT